ncbi:NUC173-domain-containing protein [Meredithblackwellia eburnea MCA 4105]
MVLLLLAEFDKVRLQLNSKIQQVRKPATLLTAIEDTLANIHNGDGDDDDDEHQLKLKLQYHRALLSTLSQIKHPKTTEEKELHQAVLYLLAILVPTIPQPALAQQALPLLTQIEPFLHLYNQDAPPLKSVLTITSTLLSSLPLTAFTTSTTLVPKKAFTTTLLLSVDPRPKVRRKAQEVIQIVLQNPPSPALVHPFAKLASAWVAERLEQAVKGAKRNEDGEEAKAIALLVFVKNLATGWDSSTNASLLPSLLSTLTLTSEHLTLSALTLLSHLFSSTTESNSPTGSLQISSTLTALLSARPPSSLLGTDNGEKLLAGWVDGVGEGVVALSRSEPNEALTRTGRDIFPNLLPMLSSATTVVLRTAIESSLTMVVKHCLSDGEVREAVVVAYGSGKEEGMKVEGEGEGGKVLRDIIDKLGHALTSTRFAGLPLPHVLAVVKALFLRLRLRAPVPGSETSGTSKKSKSTAAAASSSSSSATSTTAALVLLAPLLTTLAQLRQSHQFEWKKQLDEVLSTSVSVCGPEKFLEVLPLDLLPNSNTKGGGEWSGGRAYLLPLLKPSITNTTLSHFKQHFLPLSSQLFLLSSSAKEQGKTLEAKIYDTLVEQIWALLPGYCTYPTDLHDGSSKKPSSFDTDFLNTLTTVLYSQPSLRQAILRSLSLLLSTTLSLSQSHSPPEILYAQFGLTPSDGQKSLSLLRSMAPTVLGISFNLYTMLSKSELGSGTGNAVLAVVREWSAVLGERERDDVWDKVEGLLKGVLVGEGERDKGTPMGMGEGEKENVKIGLMDIAIALVPEKTTGGGGGAGKSMLSLVRSELVLGNRDQGVQKRGYRILNRLLEAGVLGTEAHEEDVAALVEEVVERGAKVPSGAKRDRTALLATLVSILPRTSLHHLPALLPEAVLGTKESNERTREAAYDLLVFMGKKMDQGGTLDRGKVRGMGSGQDEEMDDDDEDAEEKEKDKMEEEEKVEASLDEFVKMVSAGLAAANPHMISATITSLSRLLFEFHSSLPQETLSELLATIIIFLSSASREIVRSAIGYVKVSLVSLPVYLVEPSLPTLIPALLNWSHEHSNHFKVKIRHLLERFIKRFGIEAIERVCPEEDRKLIQNIRKRVMRSKKKKAKAAEEEAEKEMEDDDAPRPQVTGRSAYDEVLYGGSDSEVSGSEDESSPAVPAHNRKTQAKKNKAAREAGGKGTFIHEDEDEVLDLLDDRMMSKISAARPTTTTRKPLSSHFKTDESGRMQIEDSDDDDSDAGGAEGESGMGAYIEAIRGEDGHTRDAKGKAKFNKTQGKRARRDDDEAEESFVEGLKELDVGAGKKRNKKVKKDTVKIGGEFKAKHAGGDVERNGMKPYAFVPLQQVAGKNKSARGPKMDITGHKTGRKQRN